MRLIGIQLEQNNSNKFYKSSEVRSYILLILTFLRSLKLRTYLYNISFRHFIFSNEFVFELCWVGPTKICCLKKINIFNLITLVTSFSTLKRVNKKKIRLELLKTDTLRAVRFSLRAKKQTKVISKHKNLKSVLVTYLLFILNLCYRDNSLHFSSF